MAAKYVPDNEAAIILGLSKQTLRNWRTMGTKGPPYVIMGGRAIRYKVADLEAYAEARKVNPKK